MLFPVVRKAPRMLVAFFCVNVNVSLSDFSFVAFSARSHQTSVRAVPVPEHLFSFKILAFPLAFQFLASFANCSCFAGAGVNKGQYQYFL